VEHSIGYSLPNIKRQQPGPRARLLPSMPSSTCSTPRANVMYGAELHTLPRDFNDDWTVDDFKVQFSFSTLLQTTHGEKKLFSNDFSGNSQPIPRHSAAEKKCV